MNNITRITFALALIGSTALGKAEDLPAYPGAATATTTVVLPQVINTLVVTPPPPPIAVTGGTTLKIVPIENPANFTRAEWTHNERLLSTSVTELTFQSVTEREAGSYSARFFRADGTAWTSNPVKIAITDFLAHPLTNVSTRYVLQANGPAAIVGFAIGNSRDLHAEKKSVLIRAVGPSLAQFNVSQPLPDPKAALYDSAGRNITPGRVFPAIVYPDGTTPESRYLERIRETTRAVGAFPIPIQGAEFVEVADLSPGTYTIHVSSKSNQGGTVLIEVYEAPYHTKVD